MANEQAQAFITEATQSLQNEQFQQALELIDKAIALDPQNGEAHSIRAVSLSQTGQAEAASEEFRLAIQLSPGNVRVLFNFAVHLQGLGNRTEALELARQAVQVDARHAGARNLVSQLERELGQTLSTEAAATSSPYARASSAGGSGSNPSQSGYVRPGYEPTGHSIPWIEGLGRTWLIIGWAISALSLLSFIGTSLLFGAPIISILNGGSAGSQAPFNPALFFLLFGFVFVGVIYTMLDLVDTGGNWLWLVPVLVCGCCGFQWVTLPIYLAGGRRS